MVLRDKGPVYNLGFGVTTNELNFDPDGSTVEAPNPESGPVAKMLHDNPVMRFLAVGAATMVGATVAGQLIRKGGIRVGYGLQEKLIASHRFGPGFVSEHTNSIRAFNRELDSLQGVHRTAASARTDVGSIVDGGAGVVNPLFRKNEAGDIVTDLLDNRAGPQMTREEIAAIGTNKRGAIAGESYIDAIQKRMVKQARRLPYELPAAYVFDRILSDNFLGTDRGPENWANPVDVLTNFVTESVKNVAFAFAPFEVGTATSGTAFRRFMAHGDDIANMNPNAIDPKALRKAKQSVAAKNILARVGHDFSELHHRAVRFSAQSTGAMASTIEESQKSAKSIVDYWHNVRNPAASQRSAQPRPGPVEKMKNALLNETLPDVGPGSLRGLGSGVKAGRQRFREIGEAFDVHEEFTRVGGRRFAKDFAGKKTATTDRTYDEALQDYFKIRSDNAGATGFENLASRIRDLGRGGPGKPGEWNEEWFDSHFYTSQMDNEYQRILKSKILEETKDEAFTDKLINEVKIRNPGSSRDSRPLHERMRFDRKKNITGLEGQAYVKGVAEKLTHFDDKQRAFFTENIGSIVKKVDDQFRSDFVNKSFRSNVNRRFAHFQETIVPELAENVVKKRRRGYDEFLGRVTKNDQEYLQRQAARANGLQDADNIDLFEVRSHLRKRGFKDPDNSAILRGYLSDKGVISKPWQKDGFNLFGLRNVTVEEARNRGILDPTYKRGDSKSPLAGRSMADEYNLIAAGLRKKGMGTQDATLPGVYVSRKGRMIDTNLTAGAARRALAFASEQVQVPILNFNPLEALGFPAFRNVRERGAFSYVPGQGRQPFLGGQAQTTDDMYIWARTGKKSKGVVHAVGKDASGDVASRTLKGTYRPFAAEAENIVSRHMRFAVGETGQAHSPNRGKKADEFFEKVLRRVGVSPDGSTAQRLKPSSLASFFDVADDQPQSIFGYASRFVRARSRKGPDYARPSVVAGALRAGPDNVNKGVEENLEGMLASISRLGFGKGTTKGLFAEGAPLRSLSVDTGGGRVPRTIENLVGGDGRLDVSGISTPEQLKDVVTLLRKQARGATDDTVLSAHSSILSKYLDVPDEAFVGNISGQTQTTTISTRLAEAKQDIYRFLGVESALRGDFDAQDIQAKLLTLKSSRAISNNEYIESSAALLSIQSDAIRFTNRRANPNRGSDQVVRDLAMGLAAPENKPLLSPVADELIGIGDKKLTGVRAFGRRQFGSAKHEYSGTEYNPFGTDTVFVPTFGTVFDRDPRKAIASVLQWDNWKTNELGNNDSFSGSSIPGAHLFERINRYAGSLGLGIDPSGYRGGLDFYTRGLVGKRALPIVAGGTTLLAADRTLGGLVNEKDEYGDRVYSPYFTTKAARGLVEVQSAAAGLAPGGMTYGEKKEQLLEGEVPIRSGRYWPLGNTPFQGDRVQYFRPSYYRRLQSGYSYTDQSGFDSPIEKLAFGHDFSPLRPLDPYRFERQTAEERPYPVSGEYFTGPWGPLTPALNATVGRLLKPQRMMHEEATAQGLADYQSIGDQGAYLPSGAGIGYGSGPSSGAFGPGTNFTGVGKLVGGIGAGTASFSQTSDYGPDQTTGSYLAASGSIGLGSALAGRQIGAINQGYMSAATDPTTPFGSAGAPSIITNAAPTTDRGLGFQAGEMGYRLQEMFGIYGFAFGSMREGMGFGSQDFTPNRPVLESASTAYGSGRAFWDLNLGGLGDANIPTENPLGSLEFSEVVRRFIPRERSGTQSLNPIANRMGMEHQWLPGADYFNNFKAGDPYTKVPEGEMRLPGQAYERFHNVRRDQFGDYSPVDQFRILGDVAPWSEEYRMLDRSIDGLIDPYDREDVEETRYQVGEMSKKHNFTPYQHKYSDDMLSYESLIGRGLEEVSHRDTILNTKFLHKRTATEDWERDYVYGSSFPQWQTPIEDFIQPSLNKSTQRSPVEAAAYTGIIGSLFGRSAQAKAGTSLLGAAFGTGASVYGQGYEAITGERFLPKEYKEKMAVEEYSDILTYVKYKRLEGQAQTEGDEGMAKTFSGMAGKTMYGVNLNTFDPTTFLQSVPKQKREHFEAMMTAPEQERDRILSTAPRLERRMLQAAWGQPIERLPELDEYFEDRELPSEEWEGWDPRVGQDTIKIKIAQSMGLDLSEMGYYPQQVREANLMNPSYPSLNQSSGSVVQRMLRAVFRSGGTADVIPSHTPFSGDRLNIREGVGV